MEDDRLFLSHRHAQKFSDGLDVGRISTYRTFNPAFPVAYKAGLSDVILSVLAEYRDLSVLAADPIPARYLLFMTTRIKMSGPRYEVLCRRCSVSSLSTASLDISEAYTSSISTVFGKT
ncbi:uncharacterized protein ARMOST_12644 [Armillaria ostoyae]|uniref:Uncharacterized protein n=1 Tax=Armillaria ostoyae TaxID=47428 RepID=A0A284RKK2_ARMOS|nr:uncharacterized protein ARMOST_12644 [Armillaria ostoyae]